MVKTRKILNNITDRNSVIPRKSIIMFLPIIFCRDFLVMKGSSYIPFGTIKADVKSLCTAVVWCRKKLAKGLKMTEEQFLEWCIMIGNDYTKHYEKSLFNGYITNGHPTSLEGLRKFIISKGNDFQLSSENADLDAAIRYSRATYNLCDLTSFEAASESSDNGGHDAVIEVKDNDAVITADIPLADRCIKLGAKVLGPKGEEFTEDNVGSAMATRELMQTLRQFGDTRGGPAPMDKKDRSRFLGKLDQIIQAIRRE